MPSLYVGAEDTDTTGEELLPTDAEGASENFREGAARGVPEGWPPGVRDAHEECPEHGPSCPCLEHHYECPWPAETPVREDGLPLWMPQRWTKSLTGTEDFPNLWDKYNLPSGDNAWQKIWRDGPGYELDDFQVWWERHATELWPEGHRLAGTFKNRESMTLFSRQNGKTELQSCTGLIGLNWLPNPKVLAIADTVEHAGELYERVSAAVENSPRLSAKFKVYAEGHDGVKPKDGRGWLKVKASNPKSVQSYPGSIVLIDEVHLLTKLQTWSQSVAGMGGRPNQMVIGHSTAGDNFSVVLHDVQARGEAALALPPEKNDMFYAVWQSLKPEVPKYDAETDPHENRLWAEVCRANPACANGRLRREEKLPDIRKMPDPDIIRFILNWDVNSINTFIPVEDVLARVAEEGAQWPDGELIYSIARDPNWANSAITRHVKDDDGNVWTHTVATIPDATQEDLFKIAAAIDRVFHPAVIVVDGVLLRDLAIELRSASLGAEIKAISLVDMINASGKFFSLVKSERWIWFRPDPARDNALAFQLPWTKRVNANGAYRISAADSANEIEVVQAAVQGSYVADIHQTTPFQFFS